MQHQLDCDTALPLVPRYLDGELAEPRAGELRRHLLACQHCRTATQGEKALRRWFRAEAPVAVPPGFAARVARLAFAGAEPTPALVGGSSTSAAAGPREGRLLPFVLKLTAAAAVALIALAGWMGSLERPTGDDLRAEDARPLSIEELRGALEELNAPDQEAAPDPGDAQR